MKIADRENSSLGSGTAADDVIVATSSETEFEGEGLKKFEVSSEFVSGFAPSCHVPVVCKLKPNPIAPA